MSERDSVTIWHLLGRVGVLVVGLLAQYQVLRLFFLWAGFRDDTVFGFVLPLVLPAFAGGAVARLLAFPSRAGPLPIIGSVVLQVAYVAWWSLFMWSEGQSVGQSALQVALTLVGAIVGHLLILVIVRRRVSLQEFLRH